jgi:hypothetical protein
MVLWNSGRAVEGVCRDRWATGLECVVLHSQDSAARDSNQNYTSLRLHPRPDVLSSSSLLYISTNQSLAPPTTRQRKNKHNHGGPSPSIARHVPILAQDFARHASLAQHQHQCYPGQHVQPAGHCRPMPRHGQGIGCPEHSHQRHALGRLWWFASLQLSHYPRSSCLPAHHPC